jgi:hypothetical protein
MVRVDTEVQEKVSAYNLKQKWLNSSSFCLDSFKTEDIISARFPEIYPKYSKVKPSDAWDMNV